MDKLGNITLIHGDCMDFMRTQSDKSFDLSIVDPPYGIGASEMTMGSRKKKNFTKGKKWDLKPPSEEYFRELMRVCKNQIIWGGNYFSCLYPSRSWIVWDKGIYGGVSFADCELAWTSFNVSMRIAQITHRGFLCKDKIRIHPTQKPETLYKWLLHNYAKEGDKILDTHLGSGSICLACHDYGFEMTGIELDADYYDGARKRLMNHRAQQRLFTNHSFISKKC